MSKSKPQVLRHSFVIIDTTWELHCNLYFRIDLCIYKCGCITFFDSQKFPDFFYFIQRIQYRIWDLQFVLCNKNLWFSPLMWVHAYITGENLLKLLLERLVYVFKVYIISYCNHLESWLSLQKVFSSLFICETFYVVFKIIFYSCLKALSVFLFAILPSITRWILCI